MQVASFTGFIETVFIILFVYYVFKVLFRIFAPFILQNIVKKAEHKFKTQYNQQNTDSNLYEKERSTSVRPKEKKKVGDYVDYEEID